MYSLMLTELIVSPLAKWGRMLIELFVIKDNAEQIYLYGNSKQWHTVAQTYLPASFVKARSGTLSH